MASALRFQTNLPKNFLGECVLTIGYLINCTPSKLLKGKSPFELFHGHTPPYSYIKVFCCLAYAHEHQLPKDKFYDRCSCFMGYPLSKKG